MKTMQMKIGKTMMKNYLGFNEQNEQLKPAKDSCVVMVVALNGKFKWPIAHNYGALGRYF